MTNMCLKNSFGVSNGFYTGDVGRPFRGLTQGNEAALPWLITTTFLVRFRHSKRVVTQLIAHVSNVLVLIEALLHADDTEWCV